MKSVLTTSVTEEFQAPTCITEGVSIIKKHYSNVSTQAILNILLLKFAQMITAKRVKYSEFGNLGYPNHYTIIFMGSGYGKDRISNELDNRIFKNFRTWFEEKVNEYKNKEEKNIRDKIEAKYDDKDNKNNKKQIEKLIKINVAKIRNLILEINKATPEGIFAESEAFSKVDFGSLLIKYGEFGLMLKTPKQEELQCIQSIFELYDGTLSSKCIKSENSKAQLKNIPCNVLLYSDPALFAGELKKMFETLMQTGLGRRSTISYLPEGKIFIEADVDKAFQQEKEFVQKAEELSNEIFSIFLLVEPSSVYTLTKETFKQVFHPYKCKLNQMINDNDNPLIKRELASRELKALKLSCLFAALNHPTELFINPEDMKQAISVVNFLGNDFKAFVNLRPTYKDLYERVYDFFRENLNKEFTSTELKRKQYKNFGCSRKTIDKEFDEIIKYVSEIAYEQGFIFNITELQPTGYKYSLSKLPDGKLSENIIPLEELIVA